MLQKEKKKSKKNNNYYLDQNKRRKKVNKLKKISPNNENRITLILRVFKINLILTL